MSATYTAFPAGYASAERTLAAADAGRYNATALRGAGCLADTREIRMCRQIVIALLVALWISWLPARAGTLGQSIIEATGIEPVTGSEPAGKPRKWRRPANTIINAPLQVRDGKLVLVSPDATNEGVARPTQHYEIVIDPTNPPR